MAWHKAPMCGPAISARRSSCFVPPTVFVWDDLALECGGGHAVGASARVGVARSADRSTAHARHSTAREPGARSSLEARHSMRPRLGRSRRDEPYVRHRGNSEKALPAAAAGPVSLPRTWLRLAAWSF